MQNKNLDCWESKFQPCEYSDKLLNLIIELNKKARVPVNLLEIKKASHVAREYHGDQKRKSGDPYYSHPLIVAYLFAKYVAENTPKYYTTDLIIIAILHDTIEDTTLTSDMIREIFNQSVAVGVEDLTRIKGGVKITALESVDLLLSQYKEGILFIKMFDRLHNARTINFMSPKKIITILEETIRKFIFSSLYIDATHIEKEIIEICHAHLPKRQTTLSHSITSSQENHRLPSLV